ncbi:MAG: flagellar hook-length control protein FliK [Pseudomonadota bacterium]
MTIPTLFSLQHTSATVLNSESSDASHLTDLAGYFQTTLEQQIVASNIDANARVVAADRTLTGVAGNAILIGGEALPVSGTGLPAEQTTLPSLPASSNTFIDSGQRDLTSFLRALPFSDKPIERGSPLGAQYSNNKTPAQHISADTTSTASSTNVTQRSVPVQYAAPVAVAASTEVQAALKLAARNGVLFESSVKAPVSAVEQNRQQASSPVTSNTTIPSNDSPNNRIPAKEAALPAQNLLASVPTIVGTQTPAAIAEVAREFGPLSITASSAETSKIVRGVLLKPSGPTSIAGDAVQQGIQLDVSVRPLSSAGVEPVPARSSLENSSIMPSVGEQRLYPPGTLDRSASAKPSETLELAPSNTLSVQDLVVVRQVNTPLDSFDVSKDKFAEFNNTKALSINHNTISAQDSAVKFKPGDQLVSDSILMPTRQAMNAESFRNTIKSALERSLGRTPDNTVRADHSLTGDTRSLDGDTGRTIALPSVNGPLSFNAPAATSASVFGGQVLDAAAGQADAAAKLGQRIQWMLGSSARRADIQIDPPELGSVQIQVSQEDRQTTVSFVTQSSGARDLIEQSLPRLREHLENLGIELAEASVEQQSNGKPEHDDSKTDAVARSDDDSNTASDEPAAVTSPGNSNLRDGGIDAYA